LSVITSCSAKVKQYAGQKVFRDNDYLPVTTNASVETFPSQESVRKHIPAGSSAVLIVTNPSSTDAA
jgi:hypothetical protein